MSGLFVALVGPSGVGKDSLIRVLAARNARDPRFQIVRRVVTRKADADEDHDTLDEASFAARAQAGGFALHWAAHGLRYGVPVETDEALAQGQTLLCNLSRGIVGEARRRWPHTFIVALSAKPETLAARLLARGRDPDIGARLARAEPAETPDAMVENDGALDIAAEQLQALVQARRASLP